jgi:hypothetical protein
MWKALFLCFSISVGASMWPVICGYCLAGVLSANAPEAPPEKAAGERWAVILVGIPGDKEHEKLFRQTADAWEKWLTGTLLFEADHVLRLPANPAAKEKPAGLTADAIRTTFADLAKKLHDDDALWVFTLGHGNYDGKHAWFHVAGRDPSNEDFGRWLSEIRCREQVLWLTQASSGWFVKPLARPGRIVLAATAADDESNETEFPEALATVANRSIERLDADGDGKVSVAELFTAVAAEVLRRFQSDKRLPTEHAQIDDDGDGRGTEELAGKKEGDEKDPPAGAPATVKPPTAKADGELARKTLVPYREPVRKQPRDASPK